MKNKIEDLRNHLFTQLERLADDELDLEKEVQRASAIVEVGKVLIESANTEVAFLRVSTGYSNIHSAFLESKQIGE